MNQIELKIEFQDKKREQSAKAVAQVLARKQEELKQSLHISACIVLVLLRDAAGVSVTREANMYEAAMLEGFCFDFKTMTTPAILSTKTYGLVKFSPVE